MSENIYGFEVDIMALPGDIQYQLALHGLKQKLGDAAALTKEEKAEFPTPEAMAQAIATRRGNIIASLRDGKWSTKTTGPRLAGIDKHKADFAKEQLKAAFAASGKKWPSGEGSAAEISRLVGLYCEKFADKVNKEATRRMKLAADAEDLTGII